MSAPETSIPFEKQSDPQSSRTCGAACLSMVYRSLGKEVQQGEIWPAIAKQNRFGSVASTTHLMVRDALNRGFAAVAIQARHPLQVLWLCRQTGIRAILNHRLQRDSPAGHYTVLVDLDDKSVVLHDPFLGPARRTLHAELLELWLPHFPSAEIAGNVLIGVAAQPSAVPACQFCHTSIPPSVDCPQCKKPVGLQPGSLLGCVTDGCIARMWNYICCPSCDYVWTFDRQTASAGTTNANAASPPEASSEDPMKLGALFAELDKFCNHVLSLPAAVNHPDIKRNMEAIAARKEQLKLAQVEALAHLKTHQEQMANIVQSTKEKQEAHRKKMEGINTPLPPLDGDALGRALLKNLGFTS
jgi:hypothetical protein